MPPIDGNATLRDVYERVDAVRNELGEKIDDLREAVNVGVLSHEHRITIVEQTTTTQAEQILALTERVDGQGHDIAALQDRQRSDEAATSALTAARSSTSASLRWAIDAALAAAVALTTWRPWH